LIEQPFERNDAGAWRVVPASHVTGPPLYAVHSADEPIFSSGEPERDNGLEEIAEDGMPGRLAESLAAHAPGSLSAEALRPTVDPSLGIV